MGVKLQKSTLLIVMLVLIFSFSVFNFVSAQTINNPVNVDSINDYIATATDALIKVLLPIIVLFMVLSGVMFVLARGNPEKLKQAKGMVLYTAIGTAIVLGAWLIAEVVTETLDLVIGQ